MTPKSKISASRLLKFIFPDAYKDIPQYVLDRAAEFGQELHAAFETYVNDPDMKQEILEMFYSDKEKALFNEFVNWYESIKSDKMSAEYYWDTEYAHGYIDLVDWEKKIIYDYKFRNIDDKLDLTKDILQMIFYKEYSPWFYDWQLIIFDKKSGKIKILKESDIDALWLSQAKRILFLGLELYRDVEELEKKTGENLKWVKAKKILKL